MGLEPASGGRRAEHEGPAGGLTAIVGRNSPEKIYGFRLQKHLQRLAMASALKNGRDIVTQSDVDYIRSLSGCINLEYYPL